MNQYTHWNSQLAGSRWFHKKTGAEHVVALVPHDSLTVIINIENGRTTFMTELGDGPVLQELKENYKLAEGEPFF